MFFAALHQHHYAMQASYFGKPVDTTIAFRANWRRQNALCLAAYRPPTTMRCCTDLFLIN